MGGTSSRPPCLLEAGAAHAHPPHPLRVPLALGEHSPARPQPRLAEAVGALCSAYRAARPPSCARSQPSSHPSFGGTNTHFGPAGADWMLYVTSPSLAPLSAAWVWRALRVALPTWNVSPCKGFFWVWLGRCGWEASPEPEKERFPLLWVSSLPAVGTRLGRAVRGVNLTLTCPPVGHGAQRSGWGGSPWDTGPLANGDPESQL